MGLSDYEQNILKELEQDLDKDDPKFSRRLSGDNAWGRQQLYGAIIAVLGIIILILGASNNLVIIGVVGFLVMVFGAYRGFPARHKMDS